MHVFYKTEHVISALAVYNMTILGIDASSGETFFTLVRGSDFKQY